MNKLKLFLESRSLVWLALITVFLAGYYLRAYFYINYQYDFSPYDAFLEKNGGAIFDPSIQTDIFTVKTFSYPLSYLIKNCLGALDNFYFIYIIGAVVIFLLGKELSGKTFGGVLAAMLFMVAPENLLHYTKTFSPAGLNYVLSWASLLFLLKYLNTSKDTHLLYFSIASMMALLSYHTGAVALLVILAGIFISLLFREKHVDSKLIGVLLSVLGFGCFWIMMFDVEEIILLRNSILKYDSLIMLTLALVLLRFSYLIGWFSKWRWLASQWLPILALIFGGLLIFSSAPWFNQLLGLGVDYYYASPTTLNNYLAQALIAHIYLVWLIPVWPTLDQKKKIFFSGWLVGLAIILSGLVLEDYYARIFDYSFPLMFILFGMYWSNHDRWRKIVVTATMLILFVSQLIIFNDPFSLRRYYTPAEVKAASAIVDYGLKYRTVSDLRTAALFSYLGDNRVEFLDDIYHRAVFYNYHSLKEKAQNRKEQRLYLIVGESMRHIVYGTNFQTKPLDETFYQYLADNFNVVYDAGAFTVYRLK